MPWYNLGKLSADDKSMVESALIEDPSLKDQLTLDKDLMAKVVAKPDLLDKSAFASSAIRLERVLAQIDEASAPKTAKKPEPTTKENSKSSVSMFAGVKSFFTELISGSSHSFTYAVFAALTVVQLALLMFFVVPSTMKSDEGINAGLAESETTIIEEPTVELKKNPTNLFMRFTMKDNVKKGDIIEVEVLRNELPHKIENVKVVVD